MKVCVVMNPISGGGRAKPKIHGPNAKACVGKLEFACEPFLKVMSEVNPDIEVKVVETEHAEHAIALTKQYADEGWTVVGSGGDGLPLNASWPFKTFLG